MKDYTNQKYGKLTYIKRSNKKYSEGSFLWEAICECGNLKNVLPKRVKSCGCLRKTQLKNNVKLRVEKRSLKNPIDLSFSPENMYFLGFLWADGYFEKYKVCLEIISKDMNDIKSIIPKDFRFYHRTRKNRQPQSSAYLLRKEYCDYLMSLGYKDRQTPSSLLNNEFSYMWFRGLFDGDGCWYLNKKNNCNQVCVSSNYDQDWNYLENLFKELDCKYSIKRVIVKNGNKYSFVRTTCKKSIVKLYNYLYQDNFHIGLKRKAIKSKEMIDFINQCHLIEI